LLTKARRSRPASGGSRSNRRSAAFGDNARIVKTENGGNAAANARIHIATYQTLGLDDDEGFASFLTEHYGEDAFSVIIIDGGVIKAQDTPQNLVAGMRAAGRIHAEISGDPGIIAPALQRLDHIKRVTPHELEDGWTRYEILVDSGIDARERIHELIAQYGWPLRSLHRKDATLEDVFVELTRRD
jgi:ABC-type multidrug transport system ATPase subunit